jgi:hypothetical protein
MKIGTKTLLIGAHQILWHPVCVTLAWRELHNKRWPDWKIFICIVIHDWGYWGSPNIEGEEGENHPYLGARLALRYLDDSNDLILNHVYADFCLFHSRTLSAIFSRIPSDLCWADKLSVKFDPWWLYLLRVWLSGEIHEYRKKAAELGEVPLLASNKEWYLWAQARMIRKAYARDTRPPYEEES